ncbi:phospholipid-binding protein MlaC [Photobacterium galatheae]|uniref:Toluene tolerance protein n=1 Tax=Photobacterium galatheae TaxID=1654360 RepID=A0A066RZG6_9GAMM|nr:phospholipid-binding protein MlaC [Photobacterium galatheae]KDM92768.1 toluene tolerance protein [Photobacterium galatheae]MCM0149315.1 phospholipid-binding protein MlaC [Photobacterium galatheae]
MKVFKIFWLAFVASLPLFAHAAPVDKSDPYKMMEAVSQQTFARLKAEQPQIQRNPEHLRTVVRQELLPYINTRYAAYKVLGPQLKQTSKEQRNEFVNAFSDYLVASYAQVLTQYTNQEIRIEPARKVPANSSIVSIRVDILDPQRPPIRLNFKLRKNKQSNEWQGYDMVAEGVSMITTQQSEWSGRLRTEGIDKVTRDLRAISAKPIKPEGK